jgi:hypothetical protein
MSTFTDTFRSIWDNHFNPVPPDRSPAKPPAKYKVGDWLRITKTTRAGIPFLGLIAEVKEVLELDKNYYKLQIDANDETYLPMEFYITDDMNMVEKIPPGGFAI